MKVWVVIFRADEDYVRDGGEDDIFLVGYKKIEKAQKECETHLKEVWTDELSTLEIEWAETTQPGDRLRKFMGRPKAEVDGWFDVHEIEVV